MLDLAYIDPGSGSLIIQAAIAAAIADPALLPAPDRPVPRASSRRRSEPEQPPASVDDGPGVADPPTRSQRRRPRAGAVDGTPARSATRAASSSGGRPAVPPDPAAFRGRVGRLRGEPAQAAAHRPAVCSIRLRAGPLEPATAPERPRGHPARADRVHQLPLRVDVRRAARCRPPDARRPARGDGRRLAAQGRVRLQRPVPRRPARSSSTRSRSSALEDGAPWIAYRQFCEHFLAPLALIARRDVRLASLLRRRPRRDPARPRQPAAARADAAELRPRCRTSTSTPAPSAGTPAPRRRGRPRRAHANHASARLRGRSSGTCADRRASSTGRPAGTEWADYAEHTSYGDAGDGRQGRASSRRSSTRGRRSTRVGPRREHGSLQPDRGRRRQARRRLRHRPGGRRTPLPRCPRRGRGADILPLVLDIANPSPGLGWAGASGARSLERADADVVLALALVHHLAIARNVPLPMVLGLFADLAPWAHRRVRAQGRPDGPAAARHARDVFPDYTLDGFPGGRGERFEVVREAPIEDSLRVLFLLRRR